MAAAADADQTEHGQIVTVKGADWDLPYSAAVTAAVDCPLATAAATVTGNRAVEDEAGMLTEGGTVRAAPSLETPTVIPPAGAGLESAIEQVPVESALRLAGLHDSEERVSGLRLKVTLAVVLKKLAVMVTFWFAVTMPAVARNMADEAPVGTDTSKGIVSSELLTVNCTLRVFKTSRLNWIVQVLTPNETNDVGLQLREAAAGGGTIVPPVAVT